MREKFTDSKIRGYNWPFADHAQGIPNGTVTNSTVTNRKGITPTGLNRKSIMVYTALLYKRKPNQI